MKKKLFKENKRKRTWIEAEITLENGRLSVTGSYGYSKTPRQSAAEAKKYWEYFFEEEPAQIFDMNKRMGTKFSSAKSAAKYVVDIDGVYHGLDVHKENERIYITEGCGCIHEELEKAFPVIRKLIPWHLNDMNAGCEHQTELGWGKGKNIYLTRDSANKIQIKSFEDHQKTMIIAKAKRKWENNGDIGWPWMHKRLAMDRLQRKEREKEEKKALKNYLLETVAREFKPFEMEKFENSLCAPCPECGYRYGTKWLKRDLPKEIIEIVESL